VVVWHSPRRSEDTQDLDAEYDDAAKILAAPKPKVVERISPEDAQEDYYKAFRTRVSPSHQMLSSSRQGRR
jgi:hypothetical protein